MKIITIITGGLLAILGVFAIGNGGLSFISVAFPTGVVLMLSGLAEIFSYKRSAQNQEDKHWVLIEGFSSFALGVVILSGQLVADIAVPVAFGFWCLVTGIRGLVILNVVIDKLEKDEDYYWTTAISIFNLVVGTYSFFNSWLFSLPVLMVLGGCFLAQGANVLKVGLDMTYVKPDLIKSKDELVAEAEEAARMAKADAKEAIKKAKEAKVAIKEAEDAKTFEEIIEENNESN